MDKNFFWGNSISSMQTEGGWNEDGKSKSVYDVRPATDTVSDWHFANDNYHNFEQDLDLMQDLGMNMYRFSVSWSRVIKDGNGDVNQAGLDFYDRLINGCLKRGIQPMICLYHFDMPLYLAKKYNGFLSKEVCNAFIRFGKIVVDHFSDRVKYWITFNEQNLYSMPDTFRIAGAEKAAHTISNIYQIAHNVMYCHAAIANYIHKNTDCKIGGMLAYSEVYPASPNPDDVLLTHRYEEFINNNLLNVFSYGKYSTEVLHYARRHHIQVEMLKNEMNELNQCRSDFLAFSYYQSRTLDSTKIPIDTAPNYYMQYGDKANPYLRENEWHWSIDPQGLRDVLNKIYLRYHIPVFPIENGIGLRESWDGEHEIQDNERIKYMRNHILATKQAIEEDGIEVLGYLGWGLIDILSSSGDMEKRYGVVYVNRTNHDLKDMKRVPKKSYNWLKQVIHSNGTKL
ncbi:6-phospho-beta-glucosidase [Lactobacillus colini]|uniref:6-phospho-beta-glucosidase n=1 Tax=Lactobacillus colini TaxID=1819254 RepID=A0ABS4MBZ5_9LACO|nr:glycoside hydrolase family 1 protein [Lactobacillus colini]MBP2057185.1 6-phospho-beta-glucosidase [Lactobacillus colini]